MPEVALVELPPKKSTTGSAWDVSARKDALTLLVEDENISTVQINGVRGTQAGHWRRDRWSASGTGG